jgi:hypothetical protein
MLHTVRRARATDYNRAQGIPDPTAAQTHNLLKTGRMQREVWF